MTPVVSADISKRLKPPAAEQGRIFFPALNAIRAYAALSVVVWHMPQIMKFFHVPIDMPLYEGLWRIFLRGDEAVMLFFVLSGFLITYLLLAERQRTGTVAVGKFYVRRILRIWPLYYFLVLLGFVVIPWCIGWRFYPKGLQTSVDWRPRLAFFLAMLPNVGETIWPNSVPVAHLWSVGVEEQFYLIWPALMKWFGRWALVVILAVIGLKALSYAAEAHYLATTTHARPASARRAATAPATAPSRRARPAAEATPGRRHRASAAPPTHWSFSERTLFLVLRKLRLDVMAVGGLAAYVAFSALGRPSWSRLIYHPLSALGATALLVATIVTTYRAYSPYGGVAHAGAFAWFILTVGANPRFPRRLIFAPLDFLGRISYGIYMYHVPVMFCLLRYLQYRNAAWHTGFAFFKTKHGLRIVAPPVASAGRNVALLLLVAALTVAAAAISFYGFERFFLKLKRRYTVVRSGSPEAAAAAAESPDAPPAPAEAT